MGKLYLTGFCGSTPVGTCSDGSVYAASFMGYGDFLGTYKEEGSDKGTVFHGHGLSRVPIGSYERGIIYRGVSRLNREPIGSYDNVRVYESRSLRSSQIGKYEGSQAGAAALLLFTSEFEKHAV